MRSKRTTGHVRVEEAGTAHPALVTGPDGAQLALIVGDRRALRSALTAGTIAWAFGAALTTTLDDLHAQLPLAGSTP